MVTSSASITTRDTEPGEALDPVLILRPLRDDGGRVSDAIIEFANAPWRSAFGSADRDPSGLRLLEAFPAFADRIAYLGRAIGTGESFRLLDTMPGDPSRRFVTQMTPHGASVIVVSHEVTREHALEEALASSAEGLRTFFDAVDDMVVVSALDGRIAYANPALAKNLGYSADELGGMDLLDLHPPDRRLEAETIHAAISNGELDSCPMPLQTRSGALLAVLTRVWFGRWNGADCVFGISKDLTAEQEALQKFERLFRGHPALMALSDPSGGRFTDVNDAWLATLGYSREEVIGRTSEELDIFVDPEQASAVAAQLQAEGRFGDVELTVRRRDGTTLNGLFSGEIIESQGRRYHLTVMVDQTERQRAEQALGVSEALYRSILNASPDVIAVADLAGRIRIASAAVLTMFGYEREEQIVGRSLTEFMVPDDRERVMAEVARRFAGVPVSRMGETRGLRADGSTFAAEVTGELIRDANEQPTGMVLIVRDVTERMQAEETLRASEAKYRLLADHTTDIVWLTDMDMRTTYQSPSSERLRGFTTQELFDLPLEEHVTPESFRAVVELLATELPRIVADPDYEPVTTLELEYYRKDGTTVWAEVTFSVVRDGDGRPVSILGEGRDVTERRQAEEALASSEADFRTFFDTMDDIIVVGTPDGRIVHANPALTKKLGYDSAEIRSMPMLDLHPPEVRAEAEAIYAAIWRGERNTCPLPLRGDAGALLPVETRVWFGQWNGADCVFGICKDLTAEQEALQRFERLFRHNPALMAVSDLPERRFTDVNDAWLRTLGYAREEVLGRTSAGLGLAVDPEQLQAVAEQLQAEGRIVDLELQVRCKDGTILDGLFSGEIIESQGKQYFLTVMIDQTERRHAAEALQEVTDRLSLAVRAGGVGTWDLDPVADTLVWDDQMFRLYGIMREQFGGAYDAWQAGVHPDDRERCDAEVAAALRGEREFETEFRVLWPDGTVRDIRALASVLRDTAGAPLRMIGTSWDITEPKAAGAAFERSLVDLREAQRIAHVGSWSWDAAPDAVTWSVELFHIFGLAPSATAPSFAEHLVMYTEESRGRLVADVSRAMETGEGFEAQVEIVRPDGTKRLGVSHGEAVRDANGVIVGLRGTVADLTELREAQVRVDRAQRAEMVGRLAGGVAHDFNNLLAVINGHAEFLADSIPADDPRREDVDAIHTTGARAAALARQLLAFGRRQTLRPSIVDIDDVVDALAPMLRSIVGDDVELVVPRDHPVGHVRVDRAELEQAIVNLVLNARDAMPGGGRVTIATSDIAVDVGDPWLRPPAVPGDYVRLTVADTGTGMDAETLSHVFEPFYTTKLRDKGTGLGLSSVEGAIAQSGGFATVESELGRGSSFSIHLPRAFGEPVTAPPSVSRSAPRDGRETILLVEDQPGVRAITAHTLRELGYAVIDASDPTAALAMAEAAPKSFDILVTDVIMPGVSGRELADRLTALHPGLPTLYMSGYSPEEVFGPGLLDEGTSFLAKPFDRADLAARVRALIDRRAADAG